MAAATPSDEELVGRVARKDPDALAALYDRYGSVSLALAMRILENRAEAEDVLQVVFVRVWRRAEKYEPSRGSARAWILSSSRHEAIDRLRRRETYAQATRQAALNRVSSGAPAVGGEDRQRLLEAVWALPPDQKEVLELAYFEGLSQTGIARKLGQPLGTVKTRIRLGMEKLRQALGQGQS